MNNSSSLFVSYLLGVTAVIIGLFTFRKLHLPQRLLFFYVLFSLLTDTIGHVFAIVFPKTDNHLVFDVYHFVELGLLCFAAYLFQKKLKRIILLLVTITIIASIYSFIKEGTVFFVVHGLLVKSVSVCIIYYIVSIKLAQSHYSKSIIANPSFWMSIAIVMFYACIIPFFSYFEYLTITNPTMIDKLFPIIDVLNIVRYLLFGVGFVLSTKQ